MKKITISLSLAIGLALASCGSRQSASSSDSASSRQEVAAQQTDAPELPQGVSISGDRIEITNGKGCVVDFNATWCPPCRMMHPVFESAAKEYGGSLNFVSVDVDRYGALAEKYNVSGIPCFVLLDKDGREIDRRVGAMSAEDFTSFINTSFPDALL